jgi:hypothetical protein
MRRREFIAALGGTAAWPLVARAQQPSARYRIGHLAIAAPTDSPPPPPANWDGFVQGLRKVGYVEGQNISFEHRSAHDQPDLFPKLAAELADLKVDVIFARGTWALAAAKNATRTISIVGMDLEIDPVAAGLVASIARPSGNITGLFLDLSELSGKHLQLLKDIIPGTSRVAILGDPAINALQLRELERVGRSLARIHSTLRTGRGSELSRCRQVCPRCICTDRTCGRAASSPTGRIFRICFGVAMAASKAPSKSAEFFAATTAFVCTAALRGLRRAHPRGHQTRRPPDRTSVAVRAGCESQDRESPRHHHSRNNPGARRRGDRVKPKHPPGPPMTLGIMRELGVERLIASSVNDACAMGLEGIDAKRRDRPYRSGGRRIGSR